MIIDGVACLLSQDQDVDEVMRRIEEAAATTGRFVHLVVSGNRAVSVLDTPRSRASVSVATIPFDDRDTGDVDALFGGYYDLGI